MAHATRNVFPHSMNLGQRERWFASLIWQQKSLSRNALHEITGVHKTLTGRAVGRLLDSGLICEGDPQPAPDRGRPTIPLRINDNGPMFVGLSISPGEVRLAGLSPQGQECFDEMVHQRVKSVSLVTTAARMLRRVIDRNVFAVGVTVTGVVDPQRHRMLFSSASPSGSPVSLQPIYDAAGKIPVVLDNDLHALSLRWLLTEDNADHDDRGVLLVGIDDGRVGASLLLDYRPQRGCVVAGNELGHMRLAVDTDRCFCGQRGCLECIVSTAQLRRLGAPTGRVLDKVLANPGRDRSALLKVLEHLTTGLANAVNFIRPTRLIIASPLVRHAILQQHLSDQLPAHILPGIRSQVSIGFWEQSCLQSAHNAAWLAMAEVFGRTGPTRAC